ncbi:MAG: chromosome segregation protein SMC, partial [Candidatus Poribacteria bacterium]|nr:chromosome segregation protein SMC [Candidatus Poribacteria bacterium]
MRLKELKISGFKSFADPVKITVEDGLTGIVGPNGCGKSNVSDAIRWVLGEQSSRSLRCANMQDVLFNGGSEQKPAKTAEVSLTLTNDDGALPLDSPTVTVTRQLERDGSNKYFLNGAPCLLRDINELFMDTGVGRSAYSLMEQGNIDLILNARPENRRFLFDEVAGITKYKYRKKAALKKLEETEQNLVRINDVISELERETETLGRQAEKAKEFRDRQDNLRVLELELARRQWEGVTSKLDAAKAELEEANLRVHELADTITALEADVESGGERRQLLDTEIQSAQSHVHKIEAEIDRTEGNIALLQERKASLSEQRQNSASQIEALEQQIERIGLQIGEREREREQLRISLQQDEGRLTGRQRVLTALQQQIDDADKHIRDGKNSLIDLMNKGARSENEISTLEQRAEYSQTNKSRLMAAFKRVENDLSESTLKADEARRRVKDMTAQVASTKSSIGEITTRMESEMRKLEAEMRGQQDTLAMAMSRVKSLEELQRSYEGYYMGVRAVLRMAEERPDELPGMCGVVAELVRVESKYEAAMEVALGSGIQNVVTQTAEDAKAAINFLKKHRAGRVTFLPLDILRARSRMDERLTRYPGIIGWAPDLVDTDKEYQVVVENLLGNVVIAETLDDAVNVARRERTSMRLVTLDGEVVNPGGAMTGGGGQQRSAGFLQRPREIEDLKEKIGELTDILSRKDERRVRLSDELDALRKEREQKQAALQQVEIDKGGAEKDLSQITEKVDRLEQEIAVTQSELELLGAESGDIVREREEAKTRLEDIQKERSSLDRRIINLEEQRTSADAKRAEVEASVTEMKVELASRREKIEGMAGVVASLDDNRKDALSRIEEHRRAVDNHEQVVAEIEEKISTAQRSFLHLEQKKFEHVEEVTRLEDQRKELLEGLANSEKQLRADRRELEKLNKIRHNFDVRMTQMTMQERAIMERVQEKYRIHVGELKRNDEIGDDEFQVNQKVQELRGQIEAMGAVNLMAIDEYEQHRERFEFLTTQRDDVELSRESLLKAIKKINDESTARFLETFHQIQANFQIVFT